MKPKITVDELWARWDEFAKDNLTEREKRVLELRFGRNGHASTFREIAKELGLSTRERARQIEAKAVRKAKLFFDEFHDIFPVP